MVASVTCANCGHDAELQAPSDVWKCNCAAGVSPDGCDCDALNEAFGSEDNGVDEVAQETAALEARLLELRGNAAPKGNSDV